MKKFLLSLALFLGALAGATVGFGGGVPPIPSSPTYSEASQIVGTLNAFINQLNGNPAGQGGYAAQPNGVISIGSFGTGTGAGPIILNTQRGLATFTGVTIAGQATSSLAITDSLITTASVCQAQLATFSGTFGTNGTPSVFVVTPTAGTLTVVMGNTSAATTTGSQSFGVEFNCIN
jgi:hypothetical protein